MLLDALKEGERSVLKVEHVRSVSRVLLARLVNLKLGEQRLLMLHVFFLACLRKHLACGHGPSQELAVGVHGGEEAFLLTPNQIVLLLTHAQEVDSVLVREGQQLDVVEVGQEAETLIEVTLIDLR